MSDPNWKSVAETLRRARKGNDLEDQHYRVYLRAIEAGQPAEHLVKKFPGSAQAKQDLINEAGKAPKMATEALREFVAAVKTAASSNLVDYFVNSLDLISKEIGNRVDERGNPVIAPFTKEEIVDLAKEMAKKAERMEIASKVLKASSSALLKAKSEKLGSAILTVLSELKRV